MTPSHLLTNVAAMIRMAAVLVAAGLTLGGCQSVYYSAMEKVGYAKRDILVSRVKYARDAQEGAKAEITDALTEFGKVVSYEGGELQKQYERLASQLEDSEGAAETVKARIRDVESVATSLFKEWKSELAQYSSADLKARSEAQLRETRSRYDDMMAAMKRAESRLDPALRPMRDQVLFLKHNLNARAIAGLKGEVAKVDAEVGRLVTELNRAIVEADRFIANLESEPG